MGSCINITIDRWKSELEWEKSQKKMDAGGWGVDWVMMTHIWTGTGFKPPPFPTPTHNQKECIPYSYSSPRVYSTWWLCVFPRCPVTQCMFRVFFLISTTAWLYQTASSTPNSSPYMRKHTTYFHHDPCLTKSESDSYLCHEKSLTANLFVGTNFDSQDDIKQGVLNEGSLW